MSLKKALLKEYQSLLGEIKDRIRSAQYDALRAVNKELIALYWDIGRMIMQRQEGKTWGKSVVENLAHDLQTEFPGIQGFSTQNLWYMRQFYGTYYQSKQLPPEGGSFGFGCKPTKDHHLF